VDESSKDSLRSDDVEFPVDDGVVSIELLLSDKDELLDESVVALDEIESWREKASLSISSTVLL
jgi:hypothetical protein